jgi:hypothetical protein
MLVNILAQGIDNLLSPGVSEVFAELINVL